MFTFGLVVLAPRVLSREERSSPQTQPRSRSKTLRPSQNLMSGLAQSQRLYRHGVRKSAHESRNYAGRTRRASDYRCCAGDRECDLRCQRRACPAFANPAACRAGSACPWKLSHPSDFLVPGATRLELEASAGQAEAMEEVRGTRQGFFSFAGGASATAASVVSRRKVNVSCRYKRTAASVWLR